MDVNVCFLKSKDYKLTFSEIKLPISKYFGHDDPHYMKLLVDIKISP